MAKIKILYDTFDICNSIRQIDRDYYVVYDTRRKCFEIHNSQQKPNTFCITCEGALDARVIQKLQKTNSNNIKRLIQDIERHNDYIKRQSDRQLSDRVRWQAGEMFDYAMRKQDANFDDAYKTCWV